MPTEVLMPALSPTMEKGNLSKWLKKEGDAIKSGDVIAEIETDKATMEVEAVDEGTLSQILVPAGTEGVKVNTPIAFIQGEGESASAPTKSAQPDAPKGADAEAAGKAREASAEPTATLNDAGVPAQTVDYRLKTRKITTGPRKARRSIASKPVSVRFENQSMYTGDQARFYAPIKDLCPTASVTLDTEHTIAQKRDAVFDFQYGIAIDVAEINAVTSETEASKLAVAIHECAHWRQFYNWGGTLKGFRKMEKRSGEVFVADTNPNGPTAPMQPDWAPLEHAAESEEMFTSSSVREVMPVVELDGRRIGSGEPGGAARELQEALRAAAAA